MYRAHKMAKWCSKNMDDSEIFPICIPSYNRPDATLLKNLYDQNRYEVFLFVRKEQYSMYSKYADRFKIIKLSNVHDGGSTKAAIIRYCWHKNIDNIFLIDDDIRLLDFLEPAHTSGGKLVMRVHSTNVNKPYNVNAYALKMWVKLLQERKYEVALSAPGLKSDWWNIRNKNSPYVYNCGCCIQCIHVNTKLLKENDINFMPNSVVGVDDYTLQFTCMEKGLKTIVFRDLVYDCPSIGSNSGGCKDSSTVDEKYKILNQRFIDIVLKGKPHRGIGFKTTKSGWTSIKFNWNYWRIKEE